MRVSLNENIVHVPLKLATWRRHQQQATTHLTMLRARSTGEFPRLVGKALDAFTSRNPDLAARLRHSDLNQFYLVDEFQGKKTASKSQTSKLLAVAGFVARHPLFSARWALHKMIHRDGLVGDFGDAARQELARMGMSELLQRLDPC
jgi:hypothetical protein